VRWGAKPLKRKILLYFKLMLILLLIVFLGGCSSNGNDKAVPGTTRFLGVFFALHLNVLVINPTLISTNKIKK